jgi:heme/copper-type cytochrome/quinol oxidase subunit 2
MPSDACPERRQLTTRRGFVLGAGFSIVSLYGLWAALGRPPSGGPAAPAPEAGGQGGLGGGDGGPTPQEFQRLTEEFVAANQLPDGSVRPRRSAEAAPAESDPHAGMAGMAGMAAAAAEPAPAAVAGDAVDAPVDVYLMAYRWGYDPALLRLDVGVAYRFRMMAVDSSHGASLQLGSASRVIRLPAGRLNEQVLRFTTPGDRLLYCTVYCGLAHDRMTGRIIVG